MSKHYHPPRLCSKWNSSTHLIRLIVIVVCQAVSSARCAKPPLQYMSIAENRMLMQDRAILHVNLMNTIGLCRDPRPQVIYPPANSHKIYYPRGTLVHRCSDQTGCCPHPGEVCRPDTVAEIEKVFFVNHFALDQRYAGGHRTRLRAPVKNFTTATETLTFTNHTSCKCIKLAPDTIEHDEVASVVSRPLVTPIQSFTANSWVYHVVGGLSAVAAVMILIFVYRWMATNRAAVRGR